MTSKLEDSLEFDKMPKEGFTLLMKTIVWVVKEEEKIVYLKRKLLKIIK